MKKIAVVILSLLFVILSGNPALAKWRTYNVVEVTEDTITLQSKGGGVTVSIEKSRRPTLQVGDKVRYDKKRNRLGKNVDKE